MLKNKKVVKALTIGLATVLATPSMTAFAAAPGEPKLNDDNGSGENVEVVKEAVAVASDNEQAIKDASKLTDDAQKAEQKVYNDAYFAQVPFDEEWNDDLADVALDEYDEQTVVWEGRWPFVRPVEPDDSANEFDENAGDHLDDASGILDKGEEDLTSKLGEFDEKIEKANEAAGNAETARSNATAQAMTAEDAEKAANGTNDGYELINQRNIASDAANKAAGFAEESQKEATNAYNYYLEAKDKFEEAETIAKNANEAADKAVADGLEDAEEAVKFAKQAEADANALKKEMETALLMAKGTQAYYEGELTRIENRLNELAGEKKQLDKDYQHAHAMYDIETQAWRDAFDAVSEARKALSEAPSQWDIIGDAWKVDALEKALKAAEIALGKEGWNLYWANDKATKLEIKKELQDAYDLIKEAYEGKENQALKEAIENDIEVISGQIDDLEEKYGSNIGEIQKTLLSDDSTDEAKENAVLSLINNISKLNNASRYETDLFDGDLFMVSDADGNNKFYTYKVENGVIKVAEVTKNVQKVADGLVKDLTEDNPQRTEEEIKLITDALGTDVTFVIVDKGEFRNVPYENVVGYDISYTEEKTETKDIVRGNEDKYDKNGQKGTVSLRVSNGYFSWNEDFEVKYQKNGIGNDHEAGWFYFDKYKTGGNKWVRLNSTKVPGITLKQVEVTTTETVKKTIDASEYDKYANKTDFTVVKTNVDKGTNPVKVYNLYVNVSFETVTDLDAFITEKGADKILKYESTKVPGTVSSTTTVVDEDNPTTRMWNVAPELKDGKPIYKCVLEYINGKTFTYDPEAEESENTLRWHNSKHGGGYWEVYTKQYGSLTWWQATIGLVEAYQYNHPVKEYNKTKEVTADVQGEVDAYIVYYRTTEVGEDQYETSYTSSDFAGIGSWSELDTEKTNKTSDLGTVEDYNAKKKAYDEAKAAADKALEKFNDAKSKRDGLRNQLREAKKELSDAIKAKKKAEDDLAKAEWAFYWQDLKTAGAKAALDDITGKLAYNAGATAYNQGAKQMANMNLQAAKAKVGEYTYKANVAKKLAVDAKKARKAAVKARDAIKKIKDSNLGAEALEAAYAELEAAEQAYKDAQAAADLAAKEADAAKTAYQNIVNKINSLSSGGSSEESGTDEGTIGGVATLVVAPLEEVPAAPAAPAVGGAGVAAPAAPAEATTELATPQTALAATIPEDNNADDGLTQIMPQAPALAADIADSEHLTWWWLLVIAVLGGTGYAMYRKFQTKKEEKVTK